MPRSKTAATTDGNSVVIAPPTLTELTRGIVLGGRETFESDKQVFGWIQAKRCAVLELPRHFIAKLLGTTSTTDSGVRPHHYVQLIDMVVSATDFDAFIAKTEAPDSAWQQTKDLDGVHENQLDKEFAALVDLASGGKDIARPFSLMFGAPGCRPNPLLLKLRFSAAIEYLESVFSKIRLGSKPRKNDSGLYVDFQLLLYLGAADICFVTNENFSAEIKKSRQKTRIVRPDAM